MNYASWKINFDIPNYGTGPEYKIIELGYSAEGAWANGPIETTGVILGYVEGQPDAKELSGWDFTYLTQEQALEFCKAINPKAHLLDDGKIAMPTDTPSEITE